MLQGLLAVSLTFNSPENARDASTFIYQKAGVSGNRVGSVVEFTGESVHKVRALLESSLENSTPDY